MKMETSGMLSEEKAKAREWRDDVLSKIEDGRIESVEMQPERSASRYCDVTARGRHGGWLCMSMHVDLARPIHEKLLRALEERARRDADAERNRPPPVHRVIEREVTTTEFCYEGEVSVVLRKKKSGRERRETLQWRADCDKDGDPHWHSECGYTSACMHWKFGDDGKWKGFYFRDDHFMKMIETGDVREMLDELTGRWGDLSKYEVASFETADGCRSPDGEVRRTVEVETKRRHFVEGSFPVKVSRRKRTLPHERERGRVLDVRDDVLEWKMRCGEDGRPKRGYQEGGVDFVHVDCKFRSGGGTEWTHLIEGDADLLAGGGSGCVLAGKIRYHEMDPVDVEAVQAGPEKAAP